MTPKNKITSKSPSEALKELHKHYELSYIIFEGALTFKGFDISKLGDKPIAEVILLKNEPVQVRLLDQKPFNRTKNLINVETADIKFGGF